MIQFEGTGSITVANFGYALANLEIPGIGNYKEDVLFLFIKDSEYTDRIPLQLGTHIITSLKA